MTEVTEGDHHHIPNPDEIRDLVLKAFHKHRTWTINPTKAKWLDKWSLMFVFAIIYTALVTPYDIAFFQNVELSALFWMNQFINVIFFIDIVFNFLLHYKESPAKGGRWVRSPHLIVIHYLKGNFIIDVLSTIPYSLISYYYQSHAGFQPIRLLRLLRLTKLVKIFYGMRIIRRYRSRFSWRHSQLHIAKFFLYGTIIMHWFACLWGYTAHNSAANLEDTWMGKFINDADINDDTVPIDINKHNVQYLLSLYFSVMTLTTVGYGDITANNLYEYVVLTVAMFLGGFFWAFIIGEMCAILANMDEVKNKYQQMFDNTNYMLTDLHVEPQVAFEVREYMLHTEQSNRRQMYTHLLSNLSEDLQIKMSHSRLYRSRIDSVPFMRPLDSSIVLKIFKTLKGYVHAPNEIIDRPNTLHIIISEGFVVHKGRILTKNQSFDHEFICYGLDPATNKHRAGTARSFVEVDTLLRDEFFEIIDAGVKVSKITKDTVRLIKRARVRFALVNVAEELYRKKQEEKHKSVGISSAVQVGRNGSGRT